MIEVETREQALYVLWGLIKDGNDRWTRIAGDTLGTTRHMLQSDTGWSKSTIHRLVKILEDNGEITVKWNHQHQSYWEAYFSIVESEDKVS